MQIFILIFFMTKRFWVQVRISPKARSKLCNLTFFFLEKTLSNVNRTCDLQDPYIFNNHEANSSLVFILKLTKQESKQWLLRVCSENSPIFNLVTNDRYWPKTQLSKIIIMHIIWVTKYGQRLDVQFSWLAWGFYHQFKSVVLLEM